MTSGPIDAFIRAYLERAAPLPDAQSADFNFYASGHVDSFGLTRLIVALEDEFDIELSDEALLAPDITTISGLSRAVSAALADQGSAHAA